MNLQWFRADLMISKKYIDRGYIGNMRDGILQISIKGSKNVLLQKLDIDKLAPTKSLNIDLSVDAKGNAYMLCKVYKGIRTEKKETGRTTGLRY
jgi:hypothetical protein